MSNNIKVRNTLDLREHDGPTVMESYLKKKKIKAMEKESGIKTTLRYFILNLSENTLLYKDYEATPEIKVIHIRKDIKGFSEKLDVNEKNICDWPYGFKIMTTLKNYTLYAKTNEVYLKWIEILKAFFRNLTNTDENQSVLKINESLKISNSQEKSQSDKISKKFLAEKDNKNEKYHRHFENDWREDINIIQSNNQHTRDSMQTKAWLIKNNNFNLSNYSELLDRSNDLIDNLHQLGDNKCEKVKKTLGESTFKAKEAEIKQTSVNKINAGDGNYLIKYNLSKRNGHPDDLIADSDDITSRNKPGNDYQQRQSIPEDLLNPDHDIFNNHLHMPNPINVISHHESFEENNLSKKLNVNSSKEDSKLKNVITDNRHLIIAGGNETSQGFKMMLKVPVNNKSDGSEINSKIFRNDGYDFAQSESNNLQFVTHNQNNKNKISRGENFFEEEKNVVDKDKMQWDELNGNWTKLISSNNKIQSSIERNKNPGLILKEQSPVKQNLYDEKIMHIKKSDHNKTFEIENLTYYEDNPDLHNVSDDSKLKENNLRNSSPILKSRRRGEDIKDLTGDITTLSIDGGEKVDVKWVLKKHIGETTAYKVQIPEIVLKDHPLGRVQKLKENLSVEHHHDDSVYLGKEKSYFNERSMLSSYLNKAMSNDSKESNPNHDNAHYETVYQKIMKKPVVNSKNSIKNKKYVPRQNLSEFGDEDHHVKIANTVKIDNSTHLVDDYHMPRSNVSDIYQLKDYKGFVKDEYLQNNIKNISDANYDYQHISNEMRKIESQILKRINNSEENQFDQTINLNESGSIIDIGSHISYKRTVVTNKKVKVDKTVPGVENVFDVASLHDDQNIDDLSDIDRYYENVSKITKYSKLDTNEQWDSSLTEKDI